MDIVRITHSEHVGSDGDWTHGDDAKVAAEVARREAE